MKFLTKTDNLFTAAIVFAFFYSVQKKVTNTLPSAAVNKLQPYVKIHLRSRLYFLVLT